ncbi:MAG: 50S ribosomal protein L11 methyltransferase, partial [candidate division KSB1 bacterium]|nr:50S ribosomal protein L11 methyltransferase [candidate division KSB1 bacterium]
MNKFWIAISLSVTPETEEAITNFLFEQGAQGCYQQELRLYAYFASPDWNSIKAEQLRTYLQQLSELQFSVDPDSLLIEQIEDRDWNATWKKNL